MPRSFLATTTAEIERLQTLWDALYDAAQHTLFQSFAWNRLAAKVFGARQVPRVLVCEGSYGAAIVPACRSVAGLGLLGEELFDYRDMLSVGDDLGTVLPWTDMARPGASLRITALRGSGVRKRWLEIGLPAVPFVVAPVVRRAEVDADTFAAQHNRSTRLLRRLARVGVEFRSHSGRNGALVRTIYELKGTQAVAGENLFSDPLRREFLVAATGLGSCDVFTLESAGALVAALVTFRDGGTRRFYTTYFDSKWAHYSPGVALLFRVTQQSLAAGFDCDYMTGEQPHKMRFATCSVPLYRIDASFEDLRTIGSGMNLAAA